MQNNNNETKRNNNNNNIVFFNLIDPIQRKTTPSHAFPPIPQTEN